MPLRLYNTLTRRKEDFRPLDEKNVRMYACGPTVYDRIHIGNARPIVVFDVLYRLLRHHYGAAHVKYARNITDVDDKINNRAKERGTAIGALTAETTKWLHEDLAELGCLPPDVEPTATGHIAEMIAMIETLIAKGYAYAADGHVLFDVPAMNAKPPIPGHIYGLLSRKNRDDLIAGARVDVAPYKKDPADFVLWKPSTPDIPGWDSPWGRGRPGWHIECSAMASTHLGESFDIHGGGLDLIFPHHENEIAQSECCTGKPLAAVWMHNGFIERGGEKMAKSVGNIDRLRDLLDEFPGEAVRLMLLKTHYRSPLEFTKEGLREAKAQLDGFYRVIESASSTARSPVQSQMLPSPDLVSALLDDLNTPDFISKLHELRTKVMTEFLAGRVDSYRHQCDVLIVAGSIVGLLQANPKDWFEWQPHIARDHKNSEISDAEIDEKLSLREQARAAKDYERSDQLRDELLARGVAIEDTISGVRPIRVSALVLPNNNSVVESLHRFMTAALKSEIVDGRSQRDLLHAAQTDPSIGMRIINGRTFKIDAEVVESQRDLVDKIMLALSSSALAEKDVAEAVWRNASRFVKHADDRNEIRIALYSLSHDVEKYFIYERHVMLPNFSVHVAPNFSEFSLGEIQIVRPDEVKSRFSNFPMFNSLVDGTPSWFRVPVKASPGAADAEARRKIDVAVATLRFFHDKQAIGPNFPRPGDIEPNSTLPPPERTPVIQEETSGGISFFSRPADRFYSIDFEFALRLRKSRFAEVLDSLLHAKEGSLGEKTANALGLLAKARREETLTIRLVLYFTALEALLPSRIEPKSDRPNLLGQLIVSAYLTTGNLKKQKQIIQQIRKLYGIRNRVVHGYELSVSPSRMKEFELHVEELFYRILNKEDLSSPMSSFLLERGFELPSLSYLG